ncbi:hypothetical protein KDC22_09120 [Paenibacillus tritici]|uniref:hypothetical protein n=1 Tax=Paenibacillus tritici TaxID=1873425 RepID=UPI001BA8C532|nr:hypothetical protein [Paenibacillus tritici]QUL56622.1 hypothetical protein KDC22_09120 [Paenibacillus tritici]
MRRQPGVYPSRPRPGELLRDSPSPNRPPIHLSDAFRRARAATLALATTRARGTKLAAY